ncbi:MAG: hypothetical protein PHH14_03840 [Candidatus Margulisbacteria bacterium]|nr:hypothetical protein [Candidatus Margulisiibacteriota bacterium]
METSFANIKFGSVWDVVIIALIFALSQIIVIVVRRIIEHRLSHEPTREDKITNEIFDKIHWKNADYLNENYTKLKIAEYNLVRESLRKPYSKIKTEIKQGIIGDK